MRCDVWIQVFCEMNRENWFENLFLYLSDFFFFENAVDRYEIR